MSLNGLLSIGSGALLAQDAAVAVTGRNTANAMTEGYSRETVDLQSELAAPLVGGVVAGGITRADDARLANSERNASGASGQSASMSSALGDLDQALTPSTGGVPTALAQLFARFNELASSPQDSVLRQSVVSDATQLAATFHDGATAIAQAQSDSDARITGMAAQASQLTATIANANKALAISSDPVLADKRDLAARQLAEIVGGSARIDTDGKMRFVAGSGAVLVDGDRASTLRTVPDATLNNHVRVEAVDGVHVTNLTSAIDGGKIGGEIAFRDGTAANAATSLDQLAFDLSTKVNTVHSANAALDGTTGHNFFTAPATVAGAAANFAIDPTIVADPSLIATASPATGPGNAGGANALVAMRDQLNAAGGTKSFLDQGIAIATDVGTAAKSATDTQSLDADKLTALAAARDSTSGVSTEEELARLSAFQNAHQAATTFVASVNSMMQDLIDKL